MRFFTVHGFALLQPFPRAAILKIEKFKERLTSHLLQGVVGFSRALAVVFGGTVLAFLLFKGFVNLGVQ